jgi:ankyrin repeat protein
MEQDEAAAEIIKFTINLKVLHKDLHNPYKEGWTPLHVAMESKSGKVAAILLEHGADVHAVDSDYDTPLYIAAKGYFVEGAEMLLASGANPNCRDNLSSSPLMKAAERGHLSMVELLVKHGADINACEPDGMSLLNISAEQSSNPAVFAYLLGFGLDPYREDRAGFTPFEDMILNNDFTSYVMNSDLDFSRVRDIAKGLLATVIDMNQGGSHRILRRLLKRLPLDVRKTFMDRYPPRYVGALCSAVHHDELGSLKALLDFGADINAEGSAEGSALMVACMKGRLEAVKVLVACGAAIAYVKRDKAEDGSEVKIVRNGLDYARNFPEIQEWILVGRYTQTRRIRDDVDEDMDEDVDEEEEPDNKVGSRKTKVWEWSGICKAEIALPGVGDLHGWGRDEGRFEVLTRTASVARDLKGMVVVPMKLFEGQCPEKSRWDVP